MSAAIAQAPATQTVTIALQRLSIRNFKGIEELTIEPGGQDLEIYGRNGAGKTTIADALSWLIWGKDTSNRADFQVKKFVDDAGDTVHRMQHEVEAELSINGRALTLRKVYEEDWKTIRGSVTESFSSHTNTFYVNGVTVQANVFQSKIAEIADPEVLRHVIDPSHFNRNLTWQKRRQILFDINGEVTQEQVIASKAELAELPAILQDRTLDDHKKVVAAAKKEIKTQIETLPGRIDEAKRSMPMVERTAGEIEEQSQKLSSDRQALQEELARIDHGAQVSELKKQIAEIDAQVIRLRSELTTAAASAQREERQKLDKAEATIQEYRRTINRLVGEITDAENRLKSQNADLEILRTNFRKLAEKQFEASGIVDTCAACGQSLPSEQVEAALNNAREAFNSEIAKKKEANQTAGKNLRAEVEKNEKNIAALKEELALTREDLATYEHALQDAKEKLSAAPVVPTTSPEIESLNEQKTALQQQITELQEGTSGKRAEIEEQLKAIDAKANALAADRANLAHRQKAQERIKELMDSETKLAREFERLVREEFLMEEFVRAKAALLTEQINSRFTYVKFKLFETQVNGGISETCVCTLGGSPYDGNMSTGEKVLAGLDILSTLSNHYGVSGPVFVDNAESFTRSFRTQGAQIRLYAEEADESFFFVRTQEDALAHALHVADFRAKKLKEAQQQKA